MHRLRQRMALNRCVVLGRVGLDLNADPPGAKIETARRFTTAIGGSAGNIAAALARQGVAAMMLSCVSDDAVGRFCLAELARYGVDTRHVRLVGGERRTSLALTETVAENCQTVLYRNGAADFALSAAEVDAVEFAEAAALVLTGTALAAEPSRSAALHAIAAAHRAGALVVLDLDYRAYSWISPEEAARVCGEAARACEIVIGNDVEFGLLAGGREDGAEFARQLALRGALFTVYKRGAEGSTTFTTDGSFATPVFPVKALKPTGAGDGFLGGLVAGLAQGEELPSAVRRGAATAALIVAGVGCAPASPDRATVERFLARA
ncbi:MAG: 5-dehydro-2-deoxygluconokinase [Acetobacteraceae bacterium]